MTITEALAELKLTGKKIQQKHEFIRSHIAYPSRMRDPLEREGGTFKVIQQELQAIEALAHNILAIRYAIHQANQTTSVTIGRYTRTISEWLTWKREVVPHLTSLYDGITGNLKSVRDQARKQGMTIGDTVADDSIVINISELETEAKRDDLNETLERLDGQLSLKNATTVVAFE